MFAKEMVTEAIPERVYALCKMLIGGPMSESVVKAQMEPLVLNGGKATYFGKVLDAAVQLDLVRVDDDTKEISLIVKPDVLESHDSFKKYVVSNMNFFLLGKFSETQFYRTTQVYLENSKELFSVDKDMQNVSKLAGKINDLFRENSNSNEKLNLDNENMLAWRFWATYLGFGYLQGMFFLPNVANYLKLCIECSNIEAGKKYTVSEFISLLHPYIDICISAQDERVRTMNMALSNGFRTLNDLGIIELKYENDRQDEWNLSPMDLHEFASLITDCTYKEKK